MTDPGPDPRHGEPLAGRYRLGEILGTGATGRLWHGTDDFLARDLAIKEFSRPPNVDAALWTGLQAAALREIQAAAALTHPSAVPVYDVIETEERLWVVTQRVRAVSLAAMVEREGPLPQRRVIRMGMQLADVLANAHLQGVLHRGIKPENVLVTPAPERAILTDFGTGVITGDPGLARSGMVLGTPAYLAPEAARDGTVGPEADMWSLGATLYFALAGHPPFPHFEGLSTLTAILNEEVPALPGTGPVQALLDGLLHKTPEQRMTGTEALEVLEVLRSASGPAEGSAAGTAEGGAAETGDGTRSGADGGPGAEAPVVTEVLEHRRPEPATVQNAFGLGRGTYIAALGVLATALIVLMVGLRALSAEPTGQAAPPVPEAPGAAQPEPDGGTAQSEDPSESPAGAEQSPEVDLPLRSYRDGNGLSIEVPAEWTEIPDRSNVYFENPDGGYLRIGRIDDPATDARSHWERQEEAAAAEYPHYRLVSIEEVERPGLETFLTAADWEFTYHSPQHGSMRVVQRGLHTAEQGYSILLSGPQPQWDSLNRELLEVITLSLETGEAAPAAAGRR